MDKYIIVEKTKDQKTAGSKAPSDIAKIVHELGYEQLDVSERTMKNRYFSYLVRNAGYCIDYNKLYGEAIKDSVIILQNPFYRKQLGRYRTLKRLKANKNVKFISIVHDIIKLRDPDCSSYADKEFAQMIEIADVFILHNERMKKYFMDKGIEEGRIIKIGIFDYLTDEIQSKPQFSKKVNIAGNLDLKKSRYLSELCKITGLDFNLFGSNFDEEKISGNNITYNGAVDPEQLPEKLASGFGLVWDGDSADTCGGSFGQYLRYTNPHKLSLYLASGMPVFIWEESAEAEFVRTNHCGIAIKSLYELSERMNSVTESEYYEMQKNCLRIGSKLRRGEYTKKAIASAEKILENRFYAK